MLQHGLCMPLKHGKGRESQAENMRCLRMNKLHLAASSCAGLYAAVSVQLSVCSCLLLLGNLGQSCDFKTFPAMLLVSIPIMLLLPSLTRLLLSLKTEAAATLASATAIPTTAIPAAIC